MTGTVLTWTTWIPTMWMTQTTSCHMRYHLLNLLRVAVRRFDAMTPCASISFAGIGCAEEEVRDRLRPGLLERGRDLGGHAQAHILIQRKQLFKVTNTLPAYHIEYSVCSMMLPEYFCTLRYAYINFKEVLCHCDMYLLF